jgi:hypothetical protein
MLFTVRQGGLYACERLRCDGDGHLQYLLSSCFALFQGVPSVVAARGGVLLAWDLGVLDGQARLRLWSAGSAHKVQYLDYPVFEYLLLRQQGK